MNKVSDEIIFCIGSYFTYDDLNSFLKVFPIENKLQEQLLTLVYENDIETFFKEYRIYKDTKEYKEKFPDYKVNSNEPNLLRWKGKILENEFTENKFVIKEIKENFTFELNNGSLVIPRKSDGITNFKIIGNHQNIILLELDIGGQVIDIYKNTFYEESPFDLHIIPIPMYHNVKFKLKSTGPVKFNFDYVQFEEFADNRYEFWFSQRYYYFSEHLQIKEIQSNNDIIINNKKIKGNLKLDFPIRVNTFESNEKFCIKAYNKLIIMCGMCGLFYFYEYNYSD